MVYLALSQSQKFKQTMWELRALCHLRFPAQDQEVENGPTHTGLGLSTSINN